MLRNKTRDCKREIAVRKENVGNAIGKEFQENKDKGQEGLKRGVRGRERERRKDFGFLIPWRSC